MSHDDKNEGLMYPNLCWLIESDYLSNGTNHYFTADCSGSKVPWTTDPNEALRFPTKGAADYAIRYYSLLEHRPRVSDHMFGCGISPAPSADRAQEGYPGIAHDFETMRSALVQIRDECFNGHAHDIAEAALNAAPQPSTAKDSTGPSQEGLGQGDAAVAAPASSDSPHNSGAAPQALPLRHRSEQPVRGGPGESAVAAPSSARATYPDALKLAHRICEEMAHWEEEPAKDSQDDHTLALSSALLSTYQALADLADEWERHAEAFQQVYRQNKSYERAKAALDGQLCVSTDLRAAPPQFDPLTKEKP